MSIFTIAGLILATWAMLSVAGSERQASLADCRRRVEQEPAAAPSPPPPHSPKPAPAAPAPAPIARAAPAKPPAAKPPSR